MRVKISVFRTDASQRRKCLKAMTDLSIAEGGCLLLARVGGVRHAATNSVDFSLVSRRRGIWAGLIVPLFALSLAIRAEPRRVLLLHSFGREFAPLNAFSERFRTELAQELGGRVDFHDVALESAREEGGPQEDALVSYLAALFPGDRLSLIVTIGGPAARFAQKHRQRVFPSIPMLISSVDQRHLENASLTDKNAIVAVANEPARLIDNILQLLPETTNIAIIVGSSPLEKFWAEEMRSQFQRFTNRLNFDWFSGLAFAEMQSRAAALPPRSAIFYALLAVDAEGVPQEEERALKAFHAVANAPLFGLHSTQMGQGIVGGPLMAIEELSRRTAQVAVRILRGEPAGSIKTAVQRPGQPVYDWRELRRWGISEARLPMGSVVQFRQATFWEMYKWRIVAVIALCLLEAFLLGLLIVNLVTRRRAQQSLRESEERLSLAAAAADIGVWMLDVAHDQVWATANWRRMFGFPPDAAIAFGAVLQRIHPDDRAVVKRALRLAIETRTDYASEFRIVRPDGARWMAFRGRVNSATGMDRVRVLGAAVDITERKQGEQATHELSGRLISAQEHERARLAKELHDGLSQDLALLAVELELSAQKPPASPGEASELMQEFSKRTKELSDEVHRLSHGLHPAKLEQLGLAAAIGGFCREVEAGGLISVKCVCRDVPRSLPPELALCYYRVTQEALQNVVKHSGAKNATVELSEGGRRTPS